MKMKVLSTGSLQRKYTRTLDTSYSGNINIKSKYFQVWEYGKHDYSVLHKSVQFWEASCGKSWDRVCKVRGRSVRLQVTQIPDVWIHDQLYPETQTFAGNLHEEQRPRELHNSSGGLTHSEVVTRVQNNNISFPLQMQSESLLFLDSFYPQSPSIG